jgi:SAM-dependent methyltransferase
VRDGDARRLDFPDSGFDVVVSNLCLHNIAAAEERAQACREIARVLAPAARAGLRLPPHRRLRAGAAPAGLEVRRGPHVFTTFPPLRVVTARRHDDPA